MAVLLETVKNLIAHAKYGDATDGDVVISVDTTLTSDKHYHNLTINNGVTLYPAGYAIYVAGTLINNGTISAKGVQGSNGNTSGSAIADNAPIYTASSPFISAPAGGVGTDGGGVNGANNSSGGAGGTAVVTGADTMMPLLLRAGCGGGSGGSHGATPPAGKTGLRSIAGASGGAGGASTGTGASWGHGGNGGGGGGVILIYANELNNAGTITADGGNGGNGATPSGATCGAGGGGGGGVVVIFYGSVTGSGVGTVTANGGTKGTGNGGANGSNGVVFTVMG